MGCRSGSAEAGSPLGLAEEEAGPRGRPSMPSGLAAEAGSMPSRLAAEEEAGSGSRASGSAAEAPGSVPVEEEEEVGSM
jgi:hypothetical protein